MAETSKIGFPLIAADQAQKHVPANSTFDLIDALIGGVVLSATTLEDVSPSEGDAYIVPSGFTGFATSAGTQTHDVVVYTADGWHRFAPQVGMSFRVADEGVRRVYVNATVGWQAGAVMGAVTGAVLGLHVSDAIATGLSGATHTFTGLIPTRAIILGVRTWVTTAITGATDFDVGDGSTVDRFGGTLGIAAGSFNSGVVGPYATYSAGDVVLTANGGNFTGGDVGVAVDMILPAAAPA